MKMKFFLLSFLLLFARGCDFYSTSLWFFDHSHWEINPFVRILGFGWTGLLVSNAIIVGGIIYLYYYYCFKHKPGKVPSRPLRLTDYISELYYNRRGRFYQVFYKIPSNKKAFLGHAGYALIYTAIIGSFLATIHNLCQFYDLSFYNEFKEHVRRPISFILVLCMISFSWFLYRIWRKDFETTKKAFDNTA
jgi:hypothetical protein